MARITWDNIGERLFETGVDHGVLYVMGATGYEDGVAWNGLVSVAQSPEGAEASAQYADNIKYLNIISAEEFKGTIEAFTYPDEFGVCEGSVEVAPGVLIGQQNRSQFGLVYRTKIGNDVVGQDFGYKLHIVYGALAAPSEKTHQTINESPEATTFSWEFSTTPAPVTDHRPTAHLEINSTKVAAAKLTALEDLLFGTVAEGATLPTPDEVIALVEAA